MSAMSTLSTPSTGASERRLIKSAFDAARPVFARPFTRWVEEEIYLPPNSPLRPGLLYSYESMPCKRLLHEAMDDPRWERCYWSGPSQISGKTLDLTARLLYCLFELRHDCGLAAPDVDMIQAVIWTPKLRPVLLASRYRELLPARGAGSRGGKFRAVEFRNGVALYFLGFGGSDSQRTSATMRDVFLTELDQGRARSKQSIESSPALSIADRVRGWGAEGRVYGECVIHTKGDLVWQETETTPDGKPTGSGGRVFIWCPHCKCWFWPARELLTGWQEAASELEARAKAAYCCSECGSALSDRELRLANSQPRLVHRGQKVEGQAGKVTGELPPTRTLGFRTNPVHSPMITVAELAALEWRAARGEGEADARNVTNNVWNEPWDPENALGAGGPALTANFVREKTGPFEHGQVPPEAELLTLGIDVGKWLCSWVLPALKKDTTSWLVDVGEVAAAEGLASPEQAIKNALKEFLETAMVNGWPRAGAAEGAPPVTPDFVLIDSRWWPEVIYDVCREFQGRGFRVYPSMGFGSTNRRSPFRPPRAGDQQHQLGNNWFISPKPEARMNVIGVNADHWKRFLHARLLTPAGQPGAFLLWKPAEVNGRLNRMEHMNTAKAFTAEVWEERLDRSKGLVAGWKINSPSRVHREDAAALAFCAADIMGARLIAPPAAAVAAGHAPAAAGGSGSNWKIGR